MTTDKYLTDIRASLRDYFEGHAEQRDAWKKHAYYYHGQIERLLRRLIPPGQSVVEVGCATGDLLNALKPGRGLGIDFSANMLACARKKYPKLRFELDDLEDLKTRETFDYVVLSDSIGSLADVWSAFRSLRRLCRPQTRVVITYYNYLWEPILRLAELARLKARQPLQHWLPLGDIANLLNLSGFKVVQVGYHLLIPIWIPGISYLVNRFLARLPFLRRLCLVEFVVARPEPAAAKPEEYVVSVIVPTLNEKGTIGPLVERLPLMGLSTEVLFVDGTSDDGTREAILAEAARPRPGFTLKLIDQGARLGKGDAVRKGFAAATGEVLMILDSDLSVAPEDLPKFYVALQEGRGEFINGSRLNYPMEKQAMRYLNNAGNHLFGASLSWLLGRRIRDTLCGTKALFKRDYDRIAAHRGYFGDFDPFGDFDLLFGAARLGLEIVQMPVRYRSRAYGDTKISRFRHGILLARMCLFASAKLKFS
ncbi:MAG: glycosyltransferase [Elusimicrobia bacterium]|nr:glycosyltransferase [Elusimicrobiota bacterium]